MERDQASNNTTLQISAVRNSEQQVVLFISHLPFMHIPRSSIITRPIGKYVPLFNLLQQHLLI